MARRNRPRPQGAPVRKRRPNRNRAPRTAEPQAPETAVAHLEEQSRVEVMKLLRNQKADAGLLEPERLLARVVEQHPEYADTLATAETWKVLGHEDSPFVHIALHKIVEQRVVSRDPSFDMSKLARDMPWHDAVHQALEIVAAELFGLEDAPAR